ncbi:MAG: hypothetical protein AUJ96_31120 [Armatimonadetes bacterium CG2_30_66_41]|nr:type II secretion system protein M [Armatimonadota bacterium]OIO93079.1 MAG: hypothetical protein AUJ96_31120 [Armatimonadetes bacterium CG2_30_66_41]NCO92658.1 type II secretion system protein M [Armatimonadota bacterium]NCP30012.1 type II secretion system protein M [Armatimonadota bacterium]NCQ32014.1 type II secretion system protein M [Armatimonadota bacterium]
MRFSRRERKIVLAGVGAAALVGLFLKFVDPAWTEWNRLQQELTAQQRELDRRKAATNQPDYTELASQVRPQFGALLDSDSEAAHVGAKMQAMERICQISGLQIGSYHPLAPSIADDHWRRHSVKVTVEGNVAALTDALFRISNDAQMLLDVQRLDIRHKSDREADLSCDLLLATYSYSEAPLRQKRRQTAAPRLGE